MSRNVDVPFHTFNCSYRKESHEATACKREFGGACSHIKILISAGTRRKETSEYGTVAPPAHQSVQDGDTYFRVALQIVGDTG